MRKINQIGWNDMWESSGYFPTAKPKFWGSGQNKFHNTWNHCERDNCSLRWLGFFISAALPNEISAFHSRLLIPEHVILLSTFNHSDKRLSACQFYNLALSESTVQYMYVGSPKLTKLLRYCWLTSNESNNRPRHFCEIKKKIGKIKTSTFNFLCKNWWRTCNDSLTQWMCKSDAEIVDSRSHPASHHYSWTPAVHKDLEYLVYCRCNGKWYYKNQEAEAFFFYGGGIRPWCCHLLQACFLTHQSSHKWKTVVTKWQTDWLNQPTKQPSKQTNQPTN